MGAENSITGTGLDPKPAPDPKSVPSPTLDDPWAAISGLSCRLSVALSVAGFRVRDLMALDVETVIETKKNATGPVTVWVNGVKIAQAEFDVLRTRLAIRISELE